MRHRHSGGHGSTGNDFEGQAGHYDILARLLMRGPYRRIARDATRAVRQGGSVLDVGTGPGRLLLQIARLRPDLRLTGLDLAEDMAATARRNLAPLGDRATAVAADVTAMPFGDAGFDLVVSSLSTHHWADPDAGGAELARVRRPGGQIRLYDLADAPFGAIAAAVRGTRPSGDRPSGDRPSGDGPADLGLIRFRLAPWPVPALRLLVL